MRLVRDRVAVYSVAVGERIGMTQGRLFRLRITAELDGLIAPGEDLSEEMARDPLSLAILGMCQKFDALRASGGDASASAWLEAEALEEFPTEIVRALALTHPLIQAVGT